jgi:hypothetical protein
MQHSARRYNLQVWCLQDKDSLDWSVCQSWIWCRAAGFSLKPFYPLYAGAKAKCSKREMVGNSKVILLFWFRQKLGRFCQQCCAKCLASTSAYRPKSTTKKPLLPPPPTRPHNRPTHTHHHPLPYCDRIECCCKVRLFVTCKRKLFTTTELHDIC